MKIYHYTSIDNLALILKHKTLRFNRLDRVDDTEESEAYNCDGSISMGRFCFVSCWTSLEEDSIPLWKMYTPQSKGVRICIDLSIELTLPTIPHFDIMYFWGAIEYSDNNIALSRASIVINSDKNGGVSFMHTHKIGTFKHTRWSFQNEIRFRIVILPLPSHPVYKDVRKSIQAINKIEQTDDYIDALVDLEILSKMEITMSPYCTDADKITVESLVQSLNPTAKVSPSRIHGKVR